MGSQSLEVGVLVATCDRHEMLTQRSLPSILRQTQRPHHIVVVDDSRDDHVRLKNEDYIQSLEVEGVNIHYLSNIRTKGACGAWNTGIFHLADVCESLESTFLAILDDDDEWVPEYISQCMNATQNGRNDMVAADIARIKDMNHPPSQCPAPERLVASDFLIGNPGIQGSNLFIKLSVMLQAGCFDEAMRSSTDRDICIRICDLGDTKYQRVPSTLVKHYAEVDRERMTTRGSTSKNKGLEYFFRKYMGRMTNDEIERFLERADRLFGWHPKKEEIQQKRPKRTELHSLVIGFEFNESLISFFESMENEQVIGLTLVIHGNSNSKRFHDSIGHLMNRGYSCYPLFEQHTLESSTVQTLTDCCRYLCSKRPGSTGWLIGDDTDDFTTTNFFGPLEGKNIPVDVAPIIDVKLSTYLDAQRTQSAETRLRQNVEINDVTCLGSGSEAVVFTDQTTVYKVIDYWKTRNPRRELKFLQSQVGRWEDEENLFVLRKIIHDGPWAIITYDFEESQPYVGGFEESMLSLMTSCRKNGFVCNNIHPKNLVVANGNVKLIDYGSDIRPYNRTGEEMMLRRAYLSIFFALDSNLSHFHRLSLSTTDFEEMEGFAEFKHKYVELVGETNPALTQITPVKPLIDHIIIFGVITDQPRTSAKLLMSISTYFPGSKIVLLDNHSKQNELASLRNLVGELNLTCTIVDIPQQVDDADAGKFGNVYLQRPEEQSVGISQARTMVQYYVGQMMLDTPHSIGWILDDDMVFDSRALSYRDYLMKLKHEDIDVVIGTYDGSSPNPPINALRTKLVDFVHNFSWLNALPPEANLPCRVEENQKFKEECSDYYYDLSRKHTNHLERPVWLEPQYDGETVKEAKMRLLLEMNGVLAGHPITRPVSPPPVDYQTDLNDSVNRGGNTIVLNPEALTRTPNLIFSVDGYEARRSDMLWAIINRFYRGLSIKAANIPILHQPRYASTNKMDERKVIAEIMGSCLYAGLTDHLSQSLGHSFGFDDDDVNLVSEKSLHHLHHRKKAFHWNLIRVKGLMKTVSSFYHEEKMPDFVRSINLLQLDKLMSSIEHFAGSSFKCTVNEFLLNVIGNVESYAYSKKGENFR